MNGPRLSQSHASASRPAIASESPTGAPPPTRRGKRTIIRCEDFPGRQRGKSNVDVTSQDSDIEIGVCFAQPPEVQTDQEPTRRRPERYVMIYLLALSGMKGALNLVADGVFLL